MSKVERLLDRSTRAMHLSPLFTSLPVAQFFREYENDAIDDIIAADSDENRAKCVLRLAIMRELQQKLTSVIDSGMAANKRLENES